jgi:cation diffusion facilitator CzcD-associated flavoprotein CzcO
VREIPLSLGMVALVDDKDYEAVMAAGPWSARPCGRTAYAQRAQVLDDGRPTTQQLHTFLTGWPYADHQNGDGLDNQWANLRPSTHGQNMFTKRLYKNSTSGFKGVTRKKETGRWQAQIQANKQHRYLGYYDTAEDAARAYDAAARELFGDFARLNFPGGTS